TYAQHLADLGISEQQAVQGYGTVAENAGTLTQLGQIYGENYTQHNLETEVFENNGQATKKRKRLASAERASFSGSAGVGQGSLTQNSSGSY
ncbi:MAG TPA: hypothetical protein VFT74_00800, partial [Isosphaeraceae bacterium]|nr:hypothetical protein [Isosphaeraceae bacterium]